MKTVIPILLILISSLKLVGQDSKYSTGLTFATQEELQGIPLASTPYSGSSLPTKIDLSSYFPTPGNQGKQGSCVGWAVGYALKSYQENVELKQLIYFSPSYIYNQINNGRDGGSKIIDALNLVSQKGACLWNEMPYNEYDYYTQPSYTAKTNAIKYKIDYWRQVNIRDIKEVKAHLNAGFPIIIGAMVDDGFENINIYSNNTNIWKQRIGYTRGGHAMVVVGYDDYKNAFKVINSWGTNWGEKGFAWIDYDLFTIVVREGYVAKDAISGKPSEKLPDIKPVTPTQELKVTFYNTEVIHNEYDQFYGYGMRINGYLTIPAGVGNNFSVVAHFYFSNSYTQVGSNIYPKYSDYNGNAATSTQTYQTINGIQNAKWTLFIPYSAFRINSGYYWGNQYFQQTTYMYAIPTLFIDGFGLAKGNQINFYVNR